jgi:MFS family permease
MYGTNFLVLLGLAFYLVASFVLWQLLLKEPAPSVSRDDRPRPRRWPIRLAKAVITLLGGAASGAATLLVVTTVVNAGKAGTLDRSGMLAVWAVGSVVAMLFIGRAPLIRRVVTRTCLSLGVQGVALPLATLVSFVVAGTRLAGSAGTGGERTVAVLGVRLAGHLPAVWIGLGGFCIGLVLVILGDRPRRRVVGRRRASRRFRSSRAGVLSSRGRPR